MIDPFEKGVHAKTKPTHCPQGHPYTQENTYVRIRNGRENYHCKLCPQIRKGLIPKSGEGLLTDEDRKKIRAQRRTTPKKRQSIERYKDFLTKFKFSRPKDPVSDALFTIAKNNFIREGRVR